MSRLKKFLFPAILVAVLVCIVEGLSAAYYFFVIDSKTREAIEATINLSVEKSQFSLRYKGHPYFNYVCNPEFQFPDGYKPHNSRGFRMPEWPDTKAANSIRVLALGGSTTYGIGYERGEEVWPSIIQGLYRNQYHAAMDVINLGVPDYTTHEIIPVLAMLGPVLKPDIVVIHVGGNEAFDAAYRDEGGPDNTEFRFQWNYRPLSQPTQIVMRRSYFARVVGFYWIGRSGLFPSDIWSAMQYPHPTGEQLQQNAAHYTGKYFRQNLITLVALSRELHAEPFLLTQPLNPVWDNPSDPFHQIIVNAHRLNNSIILQVAAERNVRVIDLYQLMRRRELFTDALHDSEAGMKKKALLVANGILPVVQDIQTKQRAGK